MTAVTLNPAGLLSPAASNVSKTSGKTGDTADFQEMMLGKLGNQTEAKTQQTEVTFSDGTKVKVSTPRTVKKAEAVKPEEPGEIGLGTEKETLKKNNVNAEEVASVLGIMNEIIEGITKILGISQEELSSAMDALGMNEEDLLNQDSLANLVLQLNGSQDMADMLVDNGMLETFNELRSFVSETLESEGYDVQSFSQILASAKLNAGVSEQENISDITDNSENMNDLSVVADSRTTDESSEVGNEAEEESSETDTFGSAKTDDDIGSTETAGRRIEINAGTFISNLEQAAEIDQMSEAQQAQFRDIVFQVAEQIKVHISPDTTSMEMQLNPENLGRVAINISSKAGVMTAEITTENQQAKEALETQLQILKENIESRGVRVEAIEVKVSEFSFADSKNAEGNSEQYEAEKNGRNPRRDFSVAEDTDDDSSEAVRIARDILMNSGSTVNYRA